jgi:hypothetical protein
MMNEKLSLMAKFILFQISSITFSAYLPVPSRPPKLATTLASRSH